MIYLFLWHDIAIVLKVSLNTNQLNQTIYRGAT